MTIGYRTGGLPCRETGLEARGDWLAQFPYLDMPYHVGVGTCSDFGPSGWTCAVLTTNVVTGTYVNRNLTVVPAYGCVVGETLSLTDVYAVPSLDDAASAWAAGFLTPMLVAMVVWAVGQVLSVVRESF